MKTQNPLISIILPVYNRLKYLDKAIHSVLSQSYDNWELIIADNNSEERTQQYLKLYEQHSQVKLIFNSKNLGLFANLNQAISRSQGSYIILLCSDDYLLPDALKTGISLLESHPEVELLLSAHEAINSNGEKIPSAMAYYYNLIFQEYSQVFSSKEALPLLLQHGSINGNLTGMLFTRSLYERVGGFRENSRQTADWEWIYKVIRSNSILLSKTPIATVRVHSEQLSSINAKNLSNYLEVINMVKLLIQDPLLSELDSSYIWALHIMQIHLWYAFKLILKGRLLSALKLIKEIHEVTGFYKTFWAMLQSLPARWRVYWNGEFLVPPV